MRKQAIEEYSIHLWKNLIGTSDLLQAIGKPETDVQTSGNKKAIKQLVRSPERGFGNISKKLSKVKSIKIPHATNLFSLTERNTRLFPCLVIGVTAWWGLLPDQVITTQQSLSLLDPECLLHMRENLTYSIESTSGIGTGGLDQAFEPLGILSEKKRGGRKRFKRNKPGP